MNAGIFAQGPSPVAMPYGLLGRPLPVPMPDFRTFDPRRISGLQGWWDASELSSMAQNSNGTSAVSATGDPVGYWQDRSGNSRHARQTVNNNRPALQPADRNGLAGLNFDGTNDFFLCDSGAPFAAAFALAVVRRTGTPNAWGSIYGHYTTTNIAGVPSSAQSFSMQQTNAETGFLFGLLSDGAIQRANGVALATVNSSQFGVRHALMLPNTTSVNVIAVQGNVTSTVGTQFPTISLDPFSPFRVYPMRLYELLVYSRIPNTSEIQAIERYLGTKWNISIP